MTRRIIATLACLVTCFAALPGCASRTTHTANLGQPMTLEVGERIALPDRAALRYVGVIADSRCPPQVQCIRAGDADVAFEFTAHGGTPQAITLNLPKSPTATVGGWQLHLATLEFGQTPRVSVQVQRAE